MATTTFLLIRHGSHDLLGKVLVGRKTDIALNATGQEEARALCQRLSGVAIEAVLMSPRERARATAAPLAACLGLAPRICEALDEVDLGGFSGRSFSDLNTDPEWKRWCETRSDSQPPNGETIANVQRRVVETMSQLARAESGKIVALVSHGDVIKSALAHYLGISLDHLERFDIAPASVSAVVVGDGWSQVKLVNDTGGYSWR